MVGRYILCCLRDIDLYQKYITLYYNMVFARLYMFLFLTHFRPTCSRISLSRSIFILYSTAKVIKVFSTRTKVGLVYLQCGSCGSIFILSVMVGRLLVGFVWLNLQWSVSWLVDFQWGSCVSIFSFMCHGWQYNIVFWQIFSGVRVAQSSFLCHGWQIFSGVRVAQSLVFCVMVGRFFMGFVWLNLQSSV